MVTICILTTAHSPFDDRIFYREAVSLAKKAEHRVVLIAPGDGRTRTRCEGVDVVTVPRCTTRLERFTVTAARVLTEALKEKADIYHFHDPDLLPWMVVVALMGKRVVYDVHEYYGLSLQTANWLSPFLRKPVAAAVDWMEKKANMTFAGTVTVNPHMEGLFHARAKKTVTISNYPLPWFINQIRPEEAEPAARRTILYLGNLNRDRGYELIIEAMKIVHLEQPDAVCTIVGRVDYTGMDAAVPRLEDKQVEALGIRSSKTFVPFTDVPAYLRQAGVCWLPWQRTPNNELGTPVKLFEYMASGWPVVCSQLGIVSSVVEESRCGILVPPDDPRAHAEALLYLLTHAEEAARMGARGRESVIERYNWVEEEKKLLKFYEEIAQTAGRGRRAAAGHVSSSPPAADGNDLLNRITTHDHRHSF